MTLQSVTKKRFSPATPQIVASGCATSRQSLMDYYEIIGLVHIFDRTRAAQQVFWIDTLRGYPQMAQSGSSPHPKDALHFPTSPQGEVKVHCWRAAGIAV
jgi:hypothetical protein